jgi:hypothetical protein
MNFLPSPTADRSRRSSVVPLRTRSALATLLLYLASLCVLFVDFSGIPALPLGAAPLAGSALKSVLGGQAGALPLDMALVVPTTAGGGREAQALYSASLAGTAHAASLLMVYGSAQGGAVESSQPALGGRVRRIATSCQDASPIPDVSVAHHEGSHFSCKVLEGLCAAFSQGHSPRYVAVVAEGAAFRWAHFLAARAPSLPSTGLAFTHVTTDWVFGLPTDYAASKPAWPRMPLWNASLVLSGDLASKLCRMHQGQGLLQLYGPPEMLLGMLLSTLEGVTWVHDPATEVEAAAAAAAAASCPQEPLTLTKMSKQSWAACLARATLQGDAW